MFIRHSLVGLVFACASIGNAGAAPALWKVSDADSSVWLFGSIHLLPPGTEWRTERFDALMAEADRIYFETDLGPSAQPEIVALTMERGFARDGRLLNQKVDSKLMGKVRSAAEAFDVPVPTLLAMQPWLAANTISVAALVQAGYDPNSGVDTVLLQETASERQGFLETAAQQIDVIAGGSEADQVLMLAATLAETGRIVEMIDEMKASWLHGTPEDLEELLLAEMGAYGDGFMERLIVDRNRNWVEQIEGMLAENESAFLVVGAGHLVGEFSVVALLEQQGFESERVQ